MKYLIHTFRRKQGGFTLIEILVAVAITGAIAGVIGQTIMMMWDGVTENRSHLSNMMQIQNAQRWIERDCKMAQTIDVNRSDPADTGTLTMTWSDWSGTHTEVIYYLEDSDLRRRESVFSPNAYDAIEQEWVAPDRIYEVFIARDVFSGSPQTAFHRFDMTSIDADDHLVRFTMTVRNEESTRGPMTEKATFAIKPRSIW